ncbi:FREM1 [Cordylochernes scorpioides]|uniref:FREM1 n=1 Tax=Cordylochernes scorpioides TaxID=51811 RepID=A0ABY6LDP4_9ARAC|nr:FREM1 [Cordylochernes scorpioides]
MYNSGCDCQIFYCDFEAGTVRYTHWGSPLLAEDRAILEVYHVQNNATTTERVTLLFHIVNTSYDVVTVLKPLEVEDVLSGPIDDSVLQFRRLGGVCKARVSRGLWPQRGKLVVGPELKRVDVIKRKCGDFLRLGLAYKHAMPATPDLDFIQISVEVSDPQLNGGEMFTETVHLPVLLRKCHANLPPQTSFSSQHLLEVDQFVLTTVTPAVLQATDSETPVESLVYNLTQPFQPGQGYLVRLNNPSRLVLSFTQEELSGYNIAYQPPSRSVSEMEVFEARLNIYDSYFAPSEPVALHVALRPTETVAPRVIANNPIVLMEGQSRTVLPGNLQVVDGDTAIDSLQLVVVGGLLHGNLLVDEEPSSTFSYQDLLDECVVYVHDDSDSRQDHLQLQISDGPHTAMVRLEVQILPKDDSPPVLVTNLGLRVTQRDSLRITPDVLSAEDEDGSDVVYAVTQPPTAGQIWRKLPWEKTGTPVTIFTQKDINKGLVYYHHMGSKNTTDQFHITLSDTSRPPNRSPESQLVAVTVVPAGGEAPRRDPHSPNALVVHETEVGVLTDDSLHYLDSDSNQLIFTLTAPPYYVGAYTKSGGAGQLVSLAGEPRPPLKRSGYPPVSQFTQEEVTGGRVGYLPPSADIGPYPLTLAVGFSVGDPEGHILPGQLLNITILPVNNQVSDPQLNGGEMFTETVHLPVLLRKCHANLPPQTSFSSQHLLEVDQFVLTTVTPAVLQATDSETPVESLVYNLTQPFQPGQGYLVRLNNPSRLVLSFTQEELSGYNIAYQPPSRSVSEMEVFEARLNIYDSYFAPSEPVALHVALRPTETVAPRVIANNPIVLMEGQSRTVLPGNLQVADGDTAIDSLQLVVVGGLLHGNLLVDEEPSSTFSYQDLLDECVVYVHDDSDSRQDHLQLQISDGPHTAMVRLEVQILPKDDSPPVLVTNLGLRVTQRDSLRITPDVLSAEDEDGSDVVYAVTQPPTAGQIWRKLPWEKTGTPVTIFTQKDINKGLVYYHHMGSKNTTDQFHITLSDTSRPPNRSPESQLVAVTVVPAGGEAPRRDPHSPNALVVHETEVGVLTDDSLHYLDSDSNQLIFTLTAPPYYVGAYTKSGGAGQLVSLAGEPRPPLKRSGYPPVSQFTQEEVTGGRVGYLPPSADIGPYPLTLAVGFSVGDPEGHILPGQLLNITILPVNNQAPELHLRPLQVEEGSSALVSGAEVSATDPDTLSSDLQLSLFSVPLHGSLRRDGLALRVGDMLSLEDILGHRLEYVHDGSESHSDSIRLGVHDGSHFVDGTLEVKVRPVDDEAPRWKEGLLRSVIVEEDGSVQITSQVYYLHDGRDGALDDRFTVAVLDRPYPDQSTAAQPRHTLAIQVQPRKSYPPVLSPQQQPALLVEEGQSVPLALTVEDRDTTDSDLTVLVVTPPHYGRLVGSLPGSEMLTSLSAFPLAEVRHRRIFYHQSHHRRYDNKAALHAARKKDAKVLGIKFQDFNEAEASLAEAKDPCQYLQ